MKNIACVVHLCRRAGALTPVISTLPSVRIVHYVLPLLLLYGAAERSLRLIPFKDDLTFQAPGVCLR